MIYSKVTTFGRMDTVIQEEQLKGSNLVLFFEKPDQTATHEESKMIGMSTAHISKETERLLEEYRLNDLCYYDKRTQDEFYGWFIHIPDEVEDEYDDSVWSDTPMDLRKVVIYAKNHGAEWLMLDSDAAIVDGLETFEW